MYQIVPGLYLLPPQRRRSSTRSLDPYPFVWKYHRRAHPLLDVYVGETESHLWWDEYTGSIEERQQKTRPGLLRRR